MEQDNNKYIDGLVSIIMPAYNAEKNICEAIDSVLAQTYTNWELIIVNDCSADNTLKVLNNKYSNDARIKVYSLEQNSGVANARNFGFTKAKGRYLAFLDSDDKWLEFKLTVQMEEINKDSSRYFIVSSYYKMNEASIVKGKPFIPKEKISLEDQLSGSQIGCLTVFLDRTIVGEFEMPNIGHEDYLTWLNLIEKHGPAYSIESPTAIYREGNKGISSNKFKASKWQWIIYRKQLNYGFMKSSKYFVKYIFNGISKSLF